jgi:hypothetical protein
LATESRIVGSSKVRSWVFSDDKAPLHTVDLEQGELIPANTTTLAMAVVEYSDAASVCERGRQVMHSPSLPTAQSLSELSSLAHLLLQDDFPSPSCALDILNTITLNAATRPPLCSEYKLLASIHYERHEFERALAVLEAGHGASCGLDDDLAFLRSLLHLHPTTPPPAPNAAIPTALSAASARSTFSILSLLVTMLQSPEYHRLLSTEFMSLGHADAAIRHAFPGADIRDERDVVDECVSPPIGFDDLRQCLLYFSPTTLSSVGGAIRSRAFLHQMIDMWLSMPDLPTTTSPHLDIGVRHAFLVVYQGLSDDRELYEKYGRLHRRLCPVLDDAAGQQQRAVARTAEKKKLRVGVVSNFLRYHSVGRLLVNAFARLSNDFTLVVISDGSGTGAIASQFDERSDEQLDLTDVSFAAAIDAIHGLELDVVVFGDVGMDAKYSFLAHHRFAPVQVLFWGHPVTSALDSIDYVVASHNFGSSDEFQEEFTEQIVWFDTLTTSFSLPELPEEGFESRTREILGVDADKRLYTCAQSVMKMHPSFDSAIADILKRDEMAVVVLLKNEKQAAWQRVVEERIGRKMEEAGLVDWRRRVMFVPQLDARGYLELVCSASVNLDPFPFGGGVTVMESLGCGVEVVTDGSRLKVWHLADAWKKEMGEGVEKMGYGEEAVAMAMRAGGVQERKDRRERAMRSLHERDDVRVEWEEFLKRIVRY